MPWHTWFVFDIGNVLLKLAYERVVYRIVDRSLIGRDELVELLEAPGGYRDLERGSVSFEEFHHFLEEHAGYHGDLFDLRAVWSDFFDGPIEGIEEVLDRARAIYRVAFLSNSNEVHEQVIPQRYSILFRKKDRFIFSHRHKLAKPDPAIFQLTFTLLGALPSQVIFVDDLLENVNVARQLGMSAYQFTSAGELLKELERDGLLPPQRPQG